MKRTRLYLLAALSLAVACQQPSVAPRPTIPMVLSVAADSSGLGRIAAQAGHAAPDGHVAIIGEPQDAITLAMRFLGSDLVDNVSGRPGRDSLPDFAGETFTVLMDKENAPYRHFFNEGPELEGQLDSLREIAVRHALRAWGKESNAKLLIYTSSLQARYGLFDVDTLQQLTGGCSRLLSPVHVMLEKALLQDARHLLVWAPREVRHAAVYESVLQEISADPTATITVLTPDPALDVRTEFRNLLRQYQAIGGPVIDALLIDSYTAPMKSLQAELGMIRHSGTDEDAAFSQMLSPGFMMLDAAGSLVESTYEILRARNWFTHKISRPKVAYYESLESAEGELSYRPVSAYYVQRTYVSDID